MGKKQKYTRKTGGGMKKPPIMTYKPPKKKKLSAKKAGRMAGEGAEEMVQKLSMTKTKKKMPTQRLAMKKTMTRRANTGPKKLAVKGTPRVAKKTTAKLKPMKKSSTATKKKKGRKKY